MPLGALLAAIAEEIVPEQNGGTGRCGWSAGGFAAVVARSS
jgi:hypothetical protein